MRYIGNAISENRSAVMAVNAVEEVKSPERNGPAFSVSGCFHALTTVGMAATASLKIANNIAIAGWLVMAQRIRASKENSAQT